MTPAHALRSTKRASTCSVARALTCVCTCARARMHALGVQSWWFAMRVRGGHYCAHETGRRKPQKLQCWQAVRVALPARWRAAQDTCTQPARSERASEGARDLQHRRLQVAVAGAREVRACARRSQSADALPDLPLHRHTGWWRALELRSESAGGREHGRNRRRQVFVSALQRSLHFSPTPSGFGSRLQARRRRVPHAPTQVWCDGPSPVARGAPRRRAAGTRGLAGKTHPQLCLCVAPGASRGATGTGDNGWRRGTHDTHARAA